MASDASDKALERNVAFIERAIESGQVRLMMRALRQNTQIRRGISAAAVAKMITKRLSLSPLRSRAVEELEKAPVGMEEVEDGINGDDAMETECLPEVEIYLLCLAASTLCRERLFEGAAAVASDTVRRLRHFHGRRTLEPLGAKIYFYFAYAHEKLGKFEDVRPTLLAAHRTACLQHNEFAQAVLLNALVRGLLEANLIDSAFKLVSKTNFPESVSNNQFCRYLYYTGRIQAMQLDYTDAYTKLMQSIRKAPANLGFRRAVHKLAVLVQLLMGEVPDRTMFQGQGLASAMAPYLRLTQAVRRGSLLEFNQVVEANAVRFKADKTYTLAIRLSQNVVKTGLRRLNISYSRISLDDIRDKLQLENSRSAEFVCAKAIKDGVIDAVIDHDRSFMSSKDVTEVYATNDPQKAFHRRVAFCLDVHNEALKAMMYPPDAHKKPQPETKPDDSKTDEELAKEIEDELGDEPL
ncbi:hypothetical protein CTAYLR_002096 [Chrysophaeum taylorii]|uniref:PCI domain-containing protein n=1 Tax=Chrysophaeum taylorii TaxID=2483200 RepID=A0AAD7UN30_9STRA|nr:hypothetical protein CTAYLR_002096 [Chrysophaeum taylorii]